jgi:hypothetical protein
MMYAGPTGPAAPLSVPTGFTFSTDLSIASGDYVGQGSTSAIAIQTTAVAPFNMTITSLSFHNRDDVPTVNDTAEIILVSDAGLTTPTGFIATLGVSTHFAQTLGSLAIAQGQLFTIQVVNDGGGAFANGVTVVVGYTIP